jgi:transcriptional regulator with XRE-family HTH domain
MNAAPVPWTNRNAMSAAASVASAQASDATAKTASPARKTRRNPSIPTPTPTAIPTARRRDELGQFLRQRRARLTPADLGLPAGTRRRTPGLRREEVAQLAGVGVTWYTWLEQGRQINASVSVLDAIARTLRLDRAEREHLYRLADVPAVTDVGDDSLPAEVRTILDGLVPLPAVVYNGRYDVLASNATYAALFPGITHAPRAERNVLWQVFTMPACCTVFADREGELRNLVATFRGAFGRHLGEPAWTSFVDRLAAASPDFAAMWARHEVASPVSRVKVFRPDYDQAPVRAVTTSFAVSATPEARLVVYTPVGDADRIRFAELTARPPEYALCPVHAAARHATQL